MVKESKIKNPICGPDWVKVNVRNIQAKPWLAQFVQAKDNTLLWNKVYQKYLGDSLWKEIRDEAITAAGGKCQRCGRKFSRLDVHHKNYDRVGGLEKPEDLEALCTLCHHEADEERKSATEKKRIDSQFENRVNGYVSRVTRDGWGEDWRAYHNWEEAEEFFLQSLYKNYCKKHHCSCEFDDQFFIEFCNDVREGRDLDEDDDDESDMDLTDRYFW